MTHSSPVEDTATDAGFTMYTTQWCGYCHRLKSQLDREGIPFDINQLTTKPTRHPNRTSATLCRPCATPWPKDCEVMPDAITIAAVMGAWRDVVLILTT